MADSGTPSPDDPKPQGPNWVWLAMIALLGVVLVTVMISPSGDDNGTVSDPIVLDDMGAPPPAPGPLPDDPATNGPEPGPEPGVSPGPPAIDSGPPMRSIPADPPVVPPVPGEE